MAFSDHLEAKATLVEKRMRALLSRDTAVPGELADAMQYAALAGGKRIRPFLVCESAALFGLGPEDACDAAAAIEFLHTYSLVHDDLPAMDDDAMRRGQPTVHIHYDEATAILTGDALQALAFRVLADEATHPDAAVRNALVAALAGAAGPSGMVGGQLLDLAAEREPVRDLQAITRIQAMKTGTMIRCACAFGAILGQAGEAERTALEAYGDATGLAFQIADDLLDVEGDASRLGKATAKDAAAGKATFVSLLGIEGARQRLRELESEACDALSPFGDRAAHLTDAARFIANRQR